MARVVMAQEHAPAVSRDAPKAQMGAFG
jgi:hypothetical protein